MQLLGPHINTNGSCKAKPTVKQLKAKAEHEAWLKQNGVHPTQLKSKTRRSSNLRNIFTAPVSKLTTGGFGDGATGLKKEEQKYTGDKLIGIAVMHKSCLQPVFSKESARDSANMRRG
jgi:hypothetical protein